MGKFPFPISRDVFSIPSGVILFSMEGLCSPVDEITLTSFKVNQPIDKLIQMPLTDGLQEVQ